MGVHVFVVGSYSSACFTGNPVPGPTTSSRFAPENAITWPVGRSTPVEYHRALLSEPVIVEVNASAWAVSTVSIWPNGVARYEPGVTPTIPPAARNDAVVYGGWSGSMIEKVDPRNPSVGTPRSVHVCCCGSYTE